MVGKICYFEWKSWKGWRCGKFHLFSGTSPSVIDYILVYIPLWHLCADFEVMAVVGSDHLPVMATFELVSSKELATNSDRKKKRREAEDLGIRKALKVTGENKKNFQSMITSEEVKQKLEECLVLLGDGKIEEPLALVNDVYKVGSKLNYRVENDISNGFFL